MTDDEGGAVTRTFRAIDDAFRRGDLEALGRAVGDPDLLPNGHIHDSIGTCLVYAIYHSPVAFIRELLALGADPTTPQDDGFPPLIAALSTTRDVHGAPRRPDVDDVVRLLLAHGADPNQRWLNDYTPLHMAVAEGNLLAIHRLLEAGADPTLRTRIDERETALEMARATGDADMVATLERQGRPLRRRLRSGIIVLMDVPGPGPLLRRQCRYRVRLRQWHHEERLVRWAAASESVGVARLEDDGTTLITDIFVNRGQVIAGLFYGVEGMRVGGTRRLELAPHMAYGDAGVPGVIPSGATLVVEVSVLDNPAVARTERS